MADLTRIDIVQYEAQSKLLSLAKEAAAITSKKKLYPLYKKAATIRKYLKALESPYLSDTDKSSLIQCLISTAEIYDFPAAPSIISKNKPIIYINSGVGASSGNGLPSGGATHQYLRKSTSADFDVEWDTLTLSDITDIAVITNELNALQGITSNIQVQIDGKLSSSLDENHIWVGDSLNAATQVEISGAISLASDGTTELTDGVIVNSKINSAAGIVFTKMAALTASRAVTTNSSGFIEVTAVTSTELGYLSGVTSAIQPQLNAKIGTALNSAQVIVGNSSNIAENRTITGDITISNTGVVAIASEVIVNADISNTAGIVLSKLASLTATRAVVTDGSGFMIASSATATEVSYLSGVTSSIQTQLSTLLVGNQTHADMQAPGAGQDGYSVTWDNSAGEYKLTDVSGNLPPAGTAGQVLYKQSSTNFDADWQTLVITDISDVTSSAAEINILDGATVTTGEINHLVGVTSGIQSQLDGKQTRALNQGAILVGNVSNLAAALSPGSNGQVLKIVGGVPAWDTAFQDGHVIQNDTTPLTQRVNLNFHDGLVASDTGSASNVEVDLTYNFVWSGTHSFEADNLSILDETDTSKIAKFSAASITTATTRTYTLPNASGTVALNPMTTAGDLILAGASGVETRLPIGTDTYVLTSNGTTASWQAPSGGGSSAGANHEIQKGDGSGGFVGTKLFSSTDGDVVLGDSGLSGTERTFSVEGSETIISMHFELKGGGNFSWGSIGEQAALSYAPGAGILGIGNDEVTPLTVSGPQGGGGIHGLPLILKAGDGVNTNGNGSNLILDSGDGEGTGIDGSVSIFNRTPNFQSGQKTIFVGNASVAPTGNPADGVFMWTADESAASVLKLRNEHGEVMTFKRHIDADFGNAINTGDADTNDTINALITALTNIGLIATS